MVQRMNPDIFSRRGHRGLQIVLSWAWFDMVRTLTGTSRSLRKIRVGIDIRQYIYIYSVS